MTTETAVLESDASTLQKETRYLWGESGLDNHSQVSTVPTSHDQDTGTENSPSTAKNKRPLIISAAKQPPDSFKLLQRWDGFVQSVEDNEFHALIRDDSNEDYPDEEIVLDISEIPPEDTHLIKIGAVFYWSVGYVEGPRRPRERVSRIRFRRLPGWSEQELEDAKKRTRSILHSLRRD